MYLELPSKGVKIRHSHDQNWIHPPILNRNRSRMIMDFLDKLSGNYKPSKDVQPRITTILSTIQHAKTVLVSTRILVSCYLQHDTIVDVPDSQ